LQTFAEDFFQYYLKQYSVSHRENERLNNLLRCIKTQKNADTERKLWKDYQAAVKKIADDVAKYFEEHEKGQELIRLAQLIRDHKEYSESSDLWMEQFIELLHTPEINDKLTANYFNGDAVLKSYHGQVSFLNVSKKMLSVREQEALFYQ